MEKAKLNRDIKKFAMQLREGKIVSYSDEAKKEFTRLHDADRTFKALSAESIRILIVLNRSYNFIKFSYFGPNEW